MMPTAMAKTPETVSCQLAGSKISGASVKNSLPWAMCRIAFHVSAPVAAATPPPTAAGTRCDRHVKNSAAAAAIPDRAAPDTICDQLSIRTPPCLDPFACSTFRSHSRHFHSWGPETPGR